MNQEELSQVHLGKTYTSKPKGPLDTQRDRVQQVSRKNDDYTNFTVGIYDIDEAIAFYFKNVIKPTVESDGTYQEVPVMYATPERWKAVQKDGFLRDKNGKKQLPVILYKRNSLEKIRNIAAKIDANRPHNFYATAVHGSYRNPYTNFKQVLNRVPEKNWVVTVVPEFVKVSYSCKIYTDYIEQMNPLVESILYASDSYWGDPGKFKFQSFITNIKTEVGAGQDEDRVVTSEFDIKLNGYILPRTENSLHDVMGLRRNYTNVKIKISEK